MRGFLLFHGKRAASRLKREIAALEIAMAHVSKEFSEAPWYAEAGCHLERTKTFLEAGDVEGGWHCFHHAKRLTVFGMNDDEVWGESIALREEANKLSHWRRDSVKQLLNDSTKDARVRLVLALRIRDEYDANQYHKIWLTADQLRLLCLVTGVITLASLYALIFLPKDPDPWSARTLIAIASFGILGSGFSVGQTMIGMASTSKIPEYVANQWVTFMRTMFGSVTALAGYMFFSSKILKITLGDEQNQFAAYLAVAFVFGYGGEKLIKKIADTIGSSDSSK